MLYFVFLGEINIKADNLNTFLEVVEDLEVEALVKKRDDHASSDNIPPSTLRLNCTPVSEQQLTEQCNLYE